MAAKGKKIVILGAGFGGFFAVLEFQRLARHLPGVEVVLIDKNNYHMFVPLLFQVGTGGIEPGAICFPIRATLKNGGTLPPVMFRECQVLNIDLEKKKIITHRVEMLYDYLVIALGSATNYYGIPGLEQNCLSLKAITDGIHMHNRILESFEAALLEKDEEKRRELLTFVVVGGGPTGVELSSMIALFVFKMLARDFPPLVSQARVFLLEAGDALLRGMHPALGRLALERLKKVGVEVILNYRVSNCTPHCIETKDGNKISSCNVFWVGGVKPSPLTLSLPVEKYKDGRIIVNEKLEVPSAPGVYVIGDCAYSIQKATSKPYPPTAQVALRMGVSCASNIAREITGQPIVPFSYKYIGDMVLLGRNYGAAEIKGRIIRGMPAFWIYQVYHLFTMTGFKNKLITLIGWAFDYFYSRNTSKLE